MLSLRRIERDFRCRRFDGLLHEVLTQLDLAGYRGLMGGEDARAVAAVALGLRRAMELTYGPHAAVMDMTQWLADQQAGDGSFADDVVATACAAAALSRRINDPAHPYDPCLGAAHERALTAVETLIAQLIEAQASDAMPLFDAPRLAQPADVAATLALVLFVLADDEAFALSPCRSAIEQTLGARHAMDDTRIRRLQHMARITAPHHHTRAA